MESSCALVSTKGECYFPNNIEIQKNPIGTVVWIVRLIELSHCKGTNVLSYVTISCKESVNVPQFVMPLKSHLATGRHII